MARWLPALVLLLFTTPAFAVGPGDRAPEIGLNDLHGRRITIASLRGKVVIVDFWATWCAPCATSLPALQGLYAHYHAHGLEIVGLSQDTTAAVIAPFAAHHHASFRMAHDAGHTVASRYGQQAMPSSFIVDQRGIVRFTHSGFHPGDPATIESEIRGLGIH